MIFVENVGPGNVVLSSYSYMRDPLGLITRDVENTGRTVDYTYDADHRLTMEAIVDASAGNRTMQYTFDAAGNRLSRVDSIDGTTTYSNDINDRLTRTTLGSTTTKYAYDNNGNMLSALTPAGDQTSVSWDLLNRLIRIQTSGPNLGSHVTTFQYDYTGNRVGQTVDAQATRFLLDTHAALAQVVLEYTAGGVIKASYTLGNKLISQLAGGQRLYYGFDFLYLGEQRDPQSGLDYLRARYHDPNLGRFPSATTRSWGTRACRFRSTTISTAARIRSITSTRPDTTTPPRFPT